MRNPTSNRGYSLFELVMTLALFALVLTLGVPSFGAIIANHRLRVEVDALFHAVHLARKESIVRRRYMTLCPTDDGLECRPGNDWSGGWMMFINSDRNWPAVRESGEPVITWFKTHPDNRIVGNRRSFSFRATEKRATNGTLIFCDRADRGKPRALVISYTGRPRVAYADRRGRPYRCPG